MDKQEKVKVLRDGFQYAPHHPLWKALMVELADYRERMVRDATDLTLPDKETHGILGGIATLDSFRLDLEAHANKAQTEKGEGQDDE